MYSPNKEVRKILNHKYCNGQSVKYLITSFVMDKEMEGGNEKLQILFIILERFAGNQKNICSGDIIYHWRGQPNKVLEGQVVT